MQWSSFWALPQLPCSGRGDFSAGYCQYTIAPVAFHVEWSLKAPHFCPVFAGGRGDSGRSARQRPHDHRPCHGTHGPWPAWRDRLAWRSSRRHAQATRSATRGWRRALGPARPTCSLSERHLYRSDLRRTLATGGAASAQRTVRWTTVWQPLGLALGGEAGARLGATLQVPTSPDTVRRRVRQWPDPPMPTPASRGVEDGARRRRGPEGTLRVDVERHRPSDVCPNRTADTLAASLRAPPGVHLLSRDRATA